jgi:hypothetical protein
MKNIFDGIAHDAALEMGKLTHLTYDLRENRKLVLAQYGVQDEAELLSAICAGTIPEHPGYEHYLAARILEETRAEARRILAEKIEESRKS